MLRNATEGSLHKRTWGPTAPSTGNPALEDSRHREMKAMQSLPKIDTRSSWERNSNGQPSSAGGSQALYWNNDEAQRYARLNPEAPEFAPVYESMDKSESDAWDKQSSRHDASRDEGDYDAILPRESDWNAGMMSTHEEAQALRSAQSANTAYMLPLKSGLEDETAKPRLRRTISEGQLVEGEIRLQTSMPAGALNSAMSSRRQSPNPYSTGNRNNIYMTPNPSPHRVGSLVSERRGSATSAASLQAQSNMDELVIRTKALLDHQMRTNLAFAEAVAAEYGRELSSRIEAQRRAFSAEQTRRMQIMEMNARRRVADAEDAIRRQYEERQTGASAMSDRQAEFRSNSDARETVNLPAAVHRRLAELHREVMILSTELEVQKVANRQLRHDLARDEERSRAASAESGASGQAMVAGNRSPSLPESIDPRDLKNKSHQELCSIIHYLNEERNRAMRECILLSRKMESLTTHSSEDHMQNAEHGDVGSEAQRKIGSDSHTETWMDLLQIEILHLDKGMMWTSQGIENQSGISERVNAMLSELRNFSAKLENLLRGAPARRSSMDQLKRRATVWEQPKVTAPGELRSPAAMISMFDPFVQARGDTLEPYDTQGLEKRPSPALSPSEPVSHRHWQLDNKMAANAPTPDSHSHEIVQQMYALGLGAESEPARAFKGPEAGKEQHASDRSASTKEASGTAKAASATEESAKDAN